jgi:hypothetical protein
LSQRLNQRMSCVATADFFNTIDPIADMCAGKSQRGKITNPSDGGITARSNPSISLNTKG